MRPRWFLASPSSCWLVPVRAPQEEGLTRAARVDRRVVGAAVAAATPVRRQEAEPAALATRGRAVEGVPAAVRPAGWEKFASSTKRKAVRSSSQTQGAARVGESL